MADAGRIVVVCECGKRLKAPASAAGRRAKCPECGTVLVVPAPATVEAVVREPEPVGVGAAGEDDGMGAMYEMAEQAQAAPQAAGVVCPQCRAAMDERAVLCVNCGFDTRSGKAVAPVVTAAARPVDYATPAGKGTQAGRKKEVDYMAPQGSLLLGVAFSAAFALAASVVWVAVAYLTGFAIGYIAILIGAAAGVGMQVGQKGYSRAGGGVASVMTVVAIMVAKYVVLVAILARAGRHVSVFDLDTAKLGMYFFSPIGLIIIAVGVGAAFKTANGGVRD